MSETESKSIVWTKVMYRGYVLSVTSRDGGDVTPSFVEIAEFLEKYKDDIYPYVDGVNRHAFVKELEFDDDVIEREAKEKGVVDIAKDMGGVEIISDGTRHLGIRPCKLDGILENDSYDVRADTYSFDGTWVNFFGDDVLSLAGHYYASDVGKGIFTKMFGWSPVAGADKAAIPGGSVMLHIVGAKGKKSNDIYQNIKAVTHV
jgi:hypothetical protein